MGDEKDVTDKYVLLFRKRLIRIANSLNEVKNYAKEWSKIPLVVYDLLNEATKEVIRAYQKLPDK